jgi:hypothetical protein
MNKEIKIILICAILIIINSLVFYFASNPNRLKNIPCTLQPEFQRYVEGEVMVDFVQDVTKEEVNEFLASYNFDEHEIRYPLRNEYRIDFVGDTEGFLEYLNQNGFTREYNRIPSYYIFEAEENVNCKRANEIAYSYTNTSVSRVYCFGHVWGVVHVEEGTEKYWLCRLRENDIVEDTHFNGIGTTN